MKDKNKTLKKSKVEKDKKDKVKEIYNNDKFLVILHKNVEINNKMRKNNK
jgi:hypothetical protein